MPTPMREGVRVQPRLAAGKEGRAHLRCCRNFWFLTASILHITPKLEVDIVNNQSPISMPILSRNTLTAICSNMASERVIA
jgi:hypothetical protein